MIPASITHRGEWPARPALTLVLDGRDGALLPPVDGVGHLHVGGLDEGGAHGRVGGVAQAVEVSVHRADKLAVELEGVNRYLDS